MTNVKIYTTPWCTYCKMAKDFFAKNNVAYEESDVAADEAAREEMVRLTGQLGVPVIRVADKVIIGFDKPKLSQLLGIK